MKNVKVVSVGSGIEFDNGMRLYDYHNQNCCESHYLSFDDLTTKDFDGLVFDLSNDDFFERVEGYGIRLKPINGHPIGVPGYGSNNGYYSSDITLVLSNPDGGGVYKEYDVSECQDW